MRLVYTVFYVQGKYALSGLWVRGVSAIEGFLKYTSNGSSIGTSVNVHYNVGVRHLGVSVKRGSSVLLSLTIDDSDQCTILLSLTIHDSDQCTILLSLTIHDCDQYTILLSLTIHNQCTMLFSVPQTRVITKISYSYCDITITYDWFTKFYGFIW